MRWSVEKIGRSWVLRHAVTKTTRGRFKTRELAEIAAKERNDCLADGVMVKEFEVAPMVMSPKDALPIFEDMFDGFDREAMVVLSLASSGQAIALDTVHVGGVNACMAEPHTIFRTALLRNAASIILAHNHPSGHPIPSKEDILVTKRLMKAAKLLDLPLHAHYVWTPGRLEAC